MVPFQHGLRGGDEDGVVGVCASAIVGYAGQVARAAHGRCAPTYTGQVHCKSLVHELNF